MANQEQLQILKQDILAYNRWRDKNPAVEIDYYQADLHGFDLSGADLWRANLGKAKLTRAKLIGTNLLGTSLSEADISGANLKDANLGAADLTLANLYEAILIEANLNGSILNGANLNRANLSGANLNHAQLVETNFSNAFLAETMFVNVDLSQVIGLETVHHLTPSVISQSTITISKGRIPEVFLRGCGFNDIEIEQAKLAHPDITNKDIDEILYRIHDLRANRSIQISPLFISYSHADAPFVDKLETILDEKGVRFWRDIHHATAGRLEKQIDRAIRITPTLLVILSKNSTNSDWVEHEVRLARELAKESAGIPFVLSPSMIAGRLALGLSYLCNNLWNITFSISPIGKTIPLSKLKLIGSLMVSKFSTIKNKFLQVNILRKILKILAGARRATTKIR